MLPPKNICSVVCPVFYSCKIFGLAPFNISPKGFKISKLNQCFSAMLSTSIYLYTLFFFDKKPMFSNFTQLPAIVNWHFNPINMFANIMLGCIFSKKLLNIFADIDTFDHDLQKYLNMNLEKEYKKTLIHIMVGLLITAIFVLLTISFTVAIYLKLSLNFLLEMLFLHNLPLSVNAFVILQICSLIFFIKQRLVWLNEELSKLAHARTCSEQSGYYTKQYTREDREISRHQPREILDMFEIIRLKHLKLYEISKAINQVYSTQILLIIFKNFVTLTGVFLFYGNNFINNKQIETKALIHSGIQLIIAVTQIASLVLSCSRVVMETERTASLIQSVSVRYQTDDNIKLHANFFSLQLLQQKLQFTACKIFVVEENLLLTIVGAVSTYLVIAIQFQIGSPKQISTTNP